MCCVWQLPAGKGYLLWAELHQHKICEAFTTRGFLPRSPVHYMHSQHRPRHASICCRQSCRWGQQTVAQQKKAWLAGATPGWAGMQLHRQAAVLAHSPSW